MALPKIDWGARTEEETKLLVRNGLGFLTLEQIIEIIKDALPAKSDREELIAQLEEG